MDRKLEKVEIYQDRCFLIYSHKHSDKGVFKPWTNMWFRPKARGYSILKDAGRYTKEQAEDLVGSSPAAEVVKEGSKRFVQLVERDLVDRVTWEYMQEIVKLDNEIYELKKQLAPTLKSV